MPAIANEPPVGVGWQEQGVGEWTDWDRDHGLMDVCQEFRQKLLCQYPDHHFALDMQNN